MPLRNIKAVFQSAVFTGSIVTIRRKIDDFGRIVLILRPKAMDKLFQLYFHLAGVPRSSIDRIETKIQDSD